MHFEKVFTVKVRTLASGLQHISTFLPFVPIQLHREASGIPLHIELQ